MKIIITGATGFIGKPTTEQLSREHTIIQFSSKTCDITEKNETLKAFKKIGHADCVFHIAGTANLKDSYENPKKHHEINVEGTANILEASRRNSIPWIIYTSSASVYSREGTVNEADPTEPKSPYGRSKYEAESLIRQHHENYGINYTILRYFNIYGLQETIKDNHIIPAICKNISHRTPIKVTSTGEQKRDFINIRDIARINASIIDKNIKNETINIGTGIGTSINDLIAMAEKELLTKADIEYISKATQPNTVIADTTKLKKLIGDYKFIEIKNGLKEYISWFLENKGEIK